MKKIIFYILFLIVNIYTIPVLKAGDLLKDTLPCSEYGYINLNLPKNPIYLPDSLGGKNFSGKIVAVISFDSIGKIINFGIRQIVLKKKTEIHFQYINLSEIKYLSKLELEPYVLPFYDFISEYIYTKASFYPNPVLPKNCNRKINLTFFLPIGLK